VPLVNRVEKS